MLGPVEGVVEEFGAPTRRGCLWIELFGEGEVRELWRSHKWCSRPASVKPPVEEGKRDDRVKPDPEPNAEEIGRRICFRAAPDEICDQSAGDQSSFGHQDTHEHKTERARPTADRPTTKPRSAMTMPTSSSSCTAGTTHLGPRPSLGGSSSSRAIAPASVTATGHRLSVLLRDCTIAIL